MASQKVPVIRRTECHWHLAPWHETWVWFPLIQLDSAPIAHVVGKPLDPLGRAAFIALSASFLTIHFHSPFLVFTVLFHATPERDSERRD